MEYYASIKEEVIVLTGQVNEIRSKCEKVHIVKKVLFSLIYLLFLLSACSNQQSRTDYYLSLTGQSDNWELSGYEILLSSEGRKAGNGTLIMKEETEYFTDSFSFNTHAVINGVDSTIHAGSVSGRTDISEQTTGTIEGEGENSITLNDVSSVYMVIEWWDSDENENVQERIVLY